MTFLPRYRPSARPGTNLLALLAAFVLLAHLGPHLRAEPLVYPIGDLSTEEISQSSSDPEQFVVLGGWTLFVAQDIQHGEELWRTDGTEVGTTLVREITPGLSSSSIRDLTRVGDIVYFRARDFSFGYELWRTDGTAAGTYLVADIRPGLQSSSPTELTAVDDTLYFSAHTDAAGRELWKVEPGGMPEMVVDLVPGPDGSSPQKLFAMSSNVAFSATTPATGRELVISDGTALGTEIFDIRPGAASSDDLEPLGALGNGMIFFASDSDDRGVELWRLFPGIEDLDRLTDGIAGSGSANPRDAVMEGKTLYFVMDTDGGTGIWRSNGAPPVHVVSLDAKGLTLFDSDVLFTADGDLWRTTGSPAGTTKLASPDIMAVDTTGVYFTEWNELAYFLGNGGVWSTDGTASGTELEFSCPSCNVEAMAAGADAVYLSRNDGFTGHEPWRLTSSLFFRLADIANLVGLSLPVEFTPLAGSVYFSAIGDGVGRELFHWNGSGQASLVEDLEPGGSHSLPTGLMAAGSNLYYAADSPDFGDEIRVLDDPAEGSEVIDIDPGSAGSNPRPFAVVGSDFFFVVVDEDGADQLYKASGTSATQVSMFPPSSSIDDLEPPAVVGDQLFFVANDTTTGRELYRTDGSVVEMVIDLNPGSQYSSPRNLIVHNGLLYFEATDTGTQYRLWKTDGTPQNTQQVAANSIWTLFSLGAHLYYVGDDESTGRELWRTDGTPGGAELFLDIAPGTADSFIYDERSLFRAVTPGLVFFTAYQETTGAELWVTDGTLPGTYLVRDVNPGSASSIPYFMKALPTGEVVFNALTDESGWELWRSDGTESGTYQVADIAPGPESGEPSWIEIFDEWAIFRAYAGTSGIEPWVYHWAGSVEIFSNGFESGNTSSWSVTVP